MGKGGREGWREGREGKEGGERAEAANVSHMHSHVVTVCQYGKGEAVSSKDA